MYKKYNKISYVVEFNINVLTTCKILENSAKDLSTPQNKFLHQIKLLVQFQHQIFDLI